MTSSVDASFQPEANGTWQKNFVHPRERICINCPSKNIAALEPGPEKMVNGPSIATTSLSPVFNR
jgi:hypothetical protein